MHSVFKPEYFFWELTETVRKLLLVGFASFISPGSTTQLIFGLALSLFCFALQMYAQPFVDRYDDMLASAVHLATVSVFVSCILLHVRALLEVVQPTLSPVIWDRFYFGSATTLGSLVGTTFIALLVFLLMVTHSYRAQRALPVIRVRGTDRQLPPPDLSKGRVYHAFISHVWATGQDQARAIKQLLRESVPGISVFLDGASRSPQAPSLHTWQSACSARPTHGE